MKQIQLLLITALLSCAASAFSAPSSNTFAGNWKGTLEVGAMKLRLVFKIQPDATGELKGKLDSLDQGARDIPVDVVTVKDNNLHFEVKAVHGVYEGTLDKSGTKATGQWTQGAQPLPLVLEKSAEAGLALEAEKLAPEDLAANKLAAQKLAGTWNGALSAGPANLRLRVKISRTSAGAATGTMDSLDQGGKDIPLSGITLKEGQVRFEARGIGGRYEGTLDAKAGTLNGQWHQSGQSFTLDLKTGGTE